MIADGQRVTELSDITKRSAAIFAGIALAFSTPAVASDARPATVRPHYTTQAPIAMLKDLESGEILFSRGADTVSYTHLRAHETVLDLVCRLLLEKKKTHEILLCNSTLRHS